MSDEQNQRLLTNTFVINAKDSLSEIVEIQPTICYICLEDIVTTFKQFGLQNNCNHFFCFDCLSTWRRTNEKEIGGRCPLCRIRSTFIAPSWRCFTDTNDKQSLINTHKLRLKTIPCRTFLRYGSCRFGHRCYYNHRYLFHEHNNSRDLTNENSYDNQQQESSRRFSNNSHRYRPY
ncbi:hypothetical protein I4U23_006028 [Adineta vaga]|nr:hypothetical protein I4U23_006028 [Adineta vaga]